MLSRRTFLIGLNSLVIAPQVFSETLGSSAAALAGLNAPDQSNDVALPSARAPQFKVYGWNANDSHASDPNTTLIYLSGTWRSGWM